MPRVHRRLLLNKGSIRSLIKRAVGRIGTSKHHFRSARSDRKLQNFHGLLCRLDNGGQLFWVSSHMEESVCRHDSGTVNILYNMFVSIRDVGKAESPIYKTI